MKLHQVLVLGVLACGGCTVINDIDACDVRPREVRVNQRADLSDALGRPQAVAAIGGGRVLVAFSSVDEPVTEAEVRIAILNQNGTRLALCNTGDLEARVSDQQALAVEGSAVAVDVDFVGRRAVAAVGWREVEAWQSRVCLRYFDEAGCPLGPKTLLPAERIAGQPQQLALAWSIPRQALLVVFHNQRDIYARWYEGASGGGPEMLASATAISNTVVALDDDGRGALAYAAYMTASDEAEGTPQARLMLLDRDGTARGASAQHDAATFAPDLGAKHHGLAPVISIAARHGRIAFASELDRGDETPIEVRVGLLNAETGAVERVRAVDSTVGHGNPGLALMPNDDVLVAWESTVAGGTNAQLFSPELAPAFNAVSCNEGSFGVGARTTLPARGIPTVIEADQRVWIVHAAQPEYDSVGTGVVAWSMPWSQLWPQVE